MIAAALRERVLKANQALARTGLVLGTFGNVSGADHDARICAIKPSGVAYDELTPAHMVPVSLDTGEPLEHAYRPSSDTPTHVELYRAFGCGGIVHTHSECATSLAQCRLPLRCMGTTHADYFRGDVPVTRAMRPEEVDSDYERNTGLVIVETFRAAGLSPDEVAAALVANHGPFVWAADPAEAVERATVLEFLARMEIQARTIAPEAPRPGSHLIDKHYFRKHGATAYYGQPRRRS
ncbi:MAG TPA: L-ribulose-5-phosphate 4-epimerase AraD [Vicinamibacterales bacterium]|jgi:L-ribulose-5-phosphate 4-epimerase|nr:L-ribulose-5-phosphate 4-epimerase AraD [Vicinamibacterales bacterium]